jgi:hypothetical protein
MMQIYKYGGVLLWTLAVAMAANALLLPGSLPRGHAFRIGLAVITAAFAARTLYAFLWGSVRGHWANFAFILLFLGYCAGMYATVFLASEAALHAITVAMTCVPLIGLMIVPRFRAELKGRLVKAKNYFDSYFPPRTP